MAKASDPLLFRVAPHIIQDFGLNLYSDLPRVLVEYIANAYDADAKYANIQIDKEAISNERKLIKTKFELAKQKAENEGNADTLKPLEDWILPDNHSIIIDDNGYGMARNDIKEKFLIAGRRRRVVEDAVRSPGNRILMGRKGLGKLAGFGVAREIVVISRSNKSSKPLQVTLNYDDLISNPSATAIQVPEEEIADLDGFPDSGTRVILRKLLYGPLKSRMDTVERHAGDCFWQIDKEDFRISLNGEQVEFERKDFAYAWPSPKIGKEELVDGEFQTEDGRTHRPC